MGVPPNPETAQKPSVDELRLAVAPIVLGHGSPAFDASTIIGLELVGGRTTSVGLTVGTEALSGASTYADLAELPAG